MVLDKLGEIAPVIAVRGNVDTAPWAQALPETELVRAAGHSLYVLHNRSCLAVDPVGAGMAAVVFGHSHVPLAERSDGVLYLPAAPGRAVFRLPITVARLQVTTDCLRPEIVPILAV
jgi:predicted phosphodiesterase